MITQSLFNTVKVTLHRIKIQILLLFSFGNDAVTKTKTEKSGWDKILEKMSCEAKLSSKVKIGKICISENVPFYSNIYLRILWKHSDTIYGLSEKCMKMLAN